MDAFMFNIKKSLIMEYLKYFIGTANLREEDLSKILDLINVFNKYVVSIVKVNPLYYETIIKAIRHKTYPEHLMILKNDHDKEKVRLIVESIDLVILRNKPIICTIDNYQFRLLGKNNNDTRKLVSIEASWGSQTNSFIAYKSNSHNGLWRALSYQNEHFWKGNDYTVTTLLHFTLQKFINEQWNNLPEINISLSQNIYLERFLDANTRIVQDIYLSKLSEFITGDCLINQLDLYRLTHKWLLENQGKEASIKFLDETYGKNRLGLYSGVKNSLNDYISNHFTSSSISEYVMDLITEINGSRAIGSIKRTTITRLNKGNLKYYIYYYDYTFRNVRYNIPILVSPIGSKVNIFGTFDQYIKSGIYTYKIFEYTSQCNLNDERFDEFKINDNYHFIGHTFTNWFPLNKIMIDC